MSHNKQTFGYPSKEPCAVCGKYDNNQSEPRFSYTVCENHQDVPPTSIQPRCQQGDSEYHGDYCDNDPGFDNFGLLNDCKDPYTWISDASSYVECSSCHKSISRAFRNNWFSIGKNQLLRVIKSNNSSNNYLFKAWSCHNCSNLFEQETNVTMGDKEWLATHIIWLHNKISNNSSNHIDCSKEKRKNDLVNIIKKEFCNHKESRLLQQEEVILKVTEAIGLTMDYNGINMAQLGIILGESTKTVSQALGGEDLSLRRVSDYLFALGKTLKVEVVDNRTTRFKELDDA